MPFTCPNCGSLFFKTLESRLPSAQPTAILYKKRCKRCKHKYFLSQHLPAGRIQLATLEEWVLAPKMSLGATVVVSEYTRRISQGTDHTLAYQQRLRNLQKQKPKNEDTANDPTQAIG